LTVFNHNDIAVKTFSGHVEAGTYTIIWDGTDSAGNFVPSGFYRMYFVAGSFADGHWFVLNWGSDPCHTIIGTLDANGTFATNETALFPGVVANPPIDFYTDTVTIHLSHPDFPDDFFLMTTRLSPGGNSFSFYYDSLGLPSVRAD